MFIRNTNHCNTVYKEESLEEAHKDALSEHANDLHYARLKLHSTIHMLVVHATIYNVFGNGQLYVQKDSRFVSVKGTECKTNLFNVIIFI